VRIALHRSVPEFVESVVSIASTITMSLQVCGYLSPLGIVVYISLGQFCFGSMLQAYIQETTTDCFILQSNLGPQEVGAGAVVTLEDEDAVTVDALASKVMLRMINPSHTGRRRGPTPEPRAIRKRSLNSHRLI
jgi:hypothetical protein